MKSYDSLKNLPIINDFTGYNFYTLYAADFIQIM